MQYLAASSRQPEFRRKTSVLLLTLLLLVGCGGSALSNGDGSAGGGGSPSAGAAGGSGMAGGAGASCTIGDKTYASGSGTFLGPDGCNRCSCLDGKLACTLLACDPPPPKLCGGLAGGSCDSGEYCRLPDGTQCGAADQSGECTRIPRACTDNAAPVCGCDGKQYRNACSATLAGVNVAHTGACETSPPGSCSVTVDGARYPDGTGDIPAGDGCNVCTCQMGTLICTARPCKAPTPCGGFAGNICAADEYCAYGPEGMCGAADAASICKPRPKACSTLYQPVCGCDGRTYTNTCTAAREGSGVLVTGTCPAASCVVGDVIYPDGTRNIQGPACSLCSCSNGTFSCDPRGC